MARNNYSKRNNRISNSDLAIFANSILFAVNRDFIEFENYGINSEFISIFEELINEFQAMTEDKINRSLVGEAVEQREYLRKSVLNYMRSLSMRGKIVFGNQSAKYRSLSFGSLTLISDNNLLIAARQVHTSAENILPELEIEGVTQNYLDNFNEAINNYEIAINEVSNSKILRDNANETKVMKANELYNLVLKCCEYGKLIWKDVSDAKYNDYLIYPSRKSSKKNK